MAFLSHTEVYDSDDHTDHNNYYDRGDSNHRSNNDSYNKIAIIYI